MMNREDHRASADVLRIDTTNSVASSFTGAGSGTGEQPPAISVGPLIIATADPAIEVAVNYQRELNSHPEVTTSLATTEVREPMPLAAMIPATVAFDKGWRAARRSNHVGQRASEHDPESVGAAPGDPGTAEGRTPPARAGRVPWLVLGAVVLGGVVGYVGCRAWLSFHCSPTD